MSSSDTPLDLPTPVDPEHREMLGEHVVDVDIGDDGAVLLQEADIDLVGAGRRVDRAQLLAA